MNESAFSFINGPTAHTIVEAVALAPYGFAIWQSEKPGDPDAELTLRFINLLGAAPSGKHPRDLINKAMKDSLPELVGTSLDYGIREVLLRNTKTEILLRSVPKAGDEEHVFRNIVTPIEPGLVMTTFIEVTKETILERDYRTERRTHLATREYFDDVFLELLHSQSESGQSLGVFFMDIDKFKSVNDSYGHMVGDEVLTEIARRLRLIEPAPQLISHWGGDEFAVLTSWNEPENAQLAQNIMDAFKAEFHSGKTEFKLGVSLGYLTKESGVKADPRHLLRAVDSAMYEAKKSGGSRFLKATF